MNFILPTGSVFTNKPLNYVCKWKHVTVTGEARDSGDPNLFSVTSVDIEVWTLMIMPRSSRRTHTR